PRLHAHDAAGTRPSRRRSVGAVAPVAGRGPRGDFEGLEPTSVRAREKARITRGRLSAARTMAGMTDSWGIADGYHDAFGEWRTLSPTTREALRRAMGAEGDAPPPPPVLVRRAGERIEIPASARLVLEDGGELDVDGTLPSDIPLGYHELRPADDGPPLRLIVSPGR